ncbi:MAG: hypothetical protein ACR2FI_11770, partial [Burkholderiales bacterium]
MDFNGHFDFRVRVGREHGDDFFRHLDHAHLGGRNIDGDVAKKERTKKGCRRRASAFPFPPSQQRGA